MNRGDLFTAKQRRFKKGFLIASAMEVAMRVQVNCILLNDPQLTFILTTTSAQVVAKTFFQV